MCPKCGKTHNPSESCLYCLQNEEYEALLLGDQRKDNSEEPDSVVEEGGNEPVVEGVNQSEADATVEV